MGSVYRIQPYIIYIRVLSIPRFGPQNLLYVRSTIPLKQKLVTYIHVLCLANHFDVCKYSLTVSSCDCIGSSRKSLGILYIVIATMLIDWLRYHT
jgi:hypothetical protein